MTTAIPDFLWIDDCVRARQLLHRQTCVQVDANLLIRFVCKLAAIEGSLRFCIEKIQIVGLANMRKTILRNPRPHLKFFTFGETESIEWGGNAVKGVKQMPTPTRHSLSVPLRVENGKFDHTMRACFNASSLGSGVDRHVVYITRYKPADKSPKFAGQNIGLAIHCADDVARLQCN